jgi:hypothetical protein
MEVLHHCIWMAAFIHFGGYNKGVLRVRYLPYAGMDFHYYCKFAFRICMLSPLHKIKYKA